MATENSKITFKTPTQFTKLPVDWYEVPKN